MNQTEKRRKKLLEQTRSLYSDKNRIPAIHPRYKAVYQQIYTDESEKISNTLGIRTGISVLLLAGYVAMSYSGETILNVNSLQVLEKIMQNIV